ncbi:hypothetical protein FOL47_007916 [Perkinsus chesapeaki]|uniref:Poly(A) RNA polymerase mitochondrial-like central palm domain-containing protein n=1 Tax=Perkinsus chesapeaki TaxID=330153 RepID=A0A7J6LH08_PERCH|nr:hypothetical protein FOL47_007916 [Perkinsus chesapeaki]
MSTLNTIEDALNNLYPCDRPFNWIQIINSPTLADLTSIVKGQYHTDSVDISLRVFGSAATGLVSDHSDIDINLAIHDDSVEPRRFVAWLATSADLHGRFIVENWASQARVPIVKLRDLHTSKVLDISVCNYLPEINSKLIAGYVAISPKAWSKCRGLCGVQQAGGLSSYAITLMCIFLLQACGYLPCLQREANQTDSFESDADGYQEAYLRFNKDSILGNLGFADPCNIDMFYEADSPSSCTSTVATSTNVLKSSQCAIEVNEMISEEYLCYRYALEQVKVVDLIRLFFIFYNQYVFASKHTVVVSIRQGCLMTRHSSRFENLKPSNVSRRKLIIEDPFLLDVDLARVVHPDTYEQLRLEICQGFNPFSEECLKDFIETISHPGIEPVRVDGERLPRLELPVPVRRPSPTPLSDGEVGGSITPSGDLLLKRIYHIRRKN